MLKKARLSCVAFVAVLGLSGSAVAQSLPDAATQSGRLLEERFPNAPPQPLSKPPLPTPAKPESVQPQFSEGPRFVLRQVRFEGVTVYSTSQLDALTKNDIGREIAVEDLQRIADQLTGRYRNDGYMLSAAFVQPQEIADGIATIRVNEGSIHNVVFEGLEDLDASSGGILSNVRQILLSAPLRQEVLEKTLLLLNDIQGVSATAIFKASPQVPGQVDLIIPIQRKSGEWRAALNNRGSRYVGPWQASVTGIYYGAINRFDTVVLQALSGTDNQELLGVLGQYEIPLNASGTTLNAKFNRAWSEPGYTLRSFQLESLNQGVSVGIHQSLKRTRDENLKLEGNIGARYSKTKFDGALFTEDDYRSAEVNIEYDFADAGGGITLFNFGVAQGLNILGEKESGKPLLTRRDGKSDFTKLTLYTSRSQSIVSDTSVFTAFSGQFAFSQLLSAEEFGYGGASFGRAYDASEFTGDHGLSALVELRQDADLQGSTVIQAAQLFAAYDFGATWNIDDEIKGPRTTGASASIGLRYTLFQHLNGSLEVAKPLTRPVGAFAEDSNKSPRFFAGFQVSF